MRMQLIVKMLTAFFVVLTISGCSQKLIMVPTECVVPDYSEVVLDVGDKNTTLGEAKKCFSNYLRVKEANEKMVKAIKLCK